MKGTSKPPKVALWLLRHLWPEHTAEALTGDVIERLSEGQTHAWVWRQVLIAIAVSAAGLPRRRWPEFCYAVAGTMMPWLLRINFDSVPRLLHWWQLPWPLSQFVFELSGTALFAFLALIVLAAGLFATNRFRWSALFRTASINLALIALGHYSLDFLPWLLKPVPENPYLKALIIPWPLMILLFFSTFLIAAWLGCRSSTQPSRRTALS